jgi:hypothetical protein
MIRVPLRTPLISALEFRARASEVMESSCLNCGSPLDMHQPDAESPDVFLGVCADCGRWYRVEVDVALDRIWFLAVPTRADVATGDIPDSPV